MTRRLLTPILLFSLACGLLLGDGARSGYESARVERLRADVGFLASDALGGRDSGEAGLEVAAEYIADRLREAGVEPAGDRGTYFHHFTVPGGARFAGRPGATLVVGEREERWEAGAAVEAFGFAGDGEAVDAPLVFAGYGIRAKRETDDDESAGAFEYDDFTDIDVRGKVVLHFRYHPRWKREDQPFGRRASRHAAFVSKLRTLRELGAGGAIIVTPPGQNEEDLYGICHRASPRDATVPTLFARRAVVEELLRPHGKSLGAIHASIEESLKPVAFDLDGARVRFRTSQRFLRLRNVVGRLPGADEALAREHVVIGGHYDHIGRFGGQVASSNLGEIHNGADDNASGVAGFIEVARLLAAGPRPRRSVLFMGFSGEEIGLHGSREWVTAERRFRVRANGVGNGNGNGNGGAERDAGEMVSSTGERRGGEIEVRGANGEKRWIETGALEQLSGPTSIQNVVAMINLDMIGRAGEDGGVTVLGASSSPSLAKKVKALAEALDIPARIPTQTRIFGGSDHMNFQSRGVPVLFFHTGLPKVYNTPEDDADGVNFDAQAKICDLVLASAVEIANAAERPEFDASSLARGQRSRGPRLGVMIDQEHKGPGARVERVTDESVAARAGILDGDTILSFAGEKVEGFLELVSLIQSKGRGKVKVRVLRGVENVELEAEFAKR